MLVMTLLVRNEEDILAYNLEYHLAKGVDFVIATDNLSTDGTIDILHEYQKLKVLHIIHEHEDTYSQHKWVTRMARMASTEYQADWVINNDADEFWWLDETSIKDYLTAQNPEVTVLSAARHNFVPLHDKNTCPFYTRMIYRESLSLNALGKPLPPKVCHRAYAEIDVIQGNHAVKYQGVNLPALPSKLSILHFPLRSYEQFSRKIELGGAAYARNPYLDKAVGSTWRMLYQKLLADELSDYYELQQYDDTSIQAGLHEGILVEDTRLRDFFAVTTNNRIV